VPILGSVASSPRTSWFTTVIAWLRGAAGVLFLALRRFVANQGSLRAGGLTYLTLMALVPGLTVLLAIAGAFGIRDELRGWVEARFRDAPQSFVEIKDFVMRLVDGVKLEVLGTVGFLAFVWVVMSLLAKVEQALNATWRAERGRTLARRYADYVAILFLIPMLVLVSTALRTVLEFDWIWMGLPWLERFVRSGVRMLPFAFIWMAAALVYKVMPNVRVRWSAAVVAGFVAGLSWHVALGVFIQLQVRLSRSNAIYGSLALLPVLLLYLYISWMIVLWGAEVCYVVQNRRTMPVPGSELAWSPARARRLGLGLMRASADAFRGGKVLRIADFAGSSGWPRGRVEEVAALLVAGGLLHRVRSGQAVVPALPPGEIPFERVFVALDGGDEKAGFGLATDDELALQSARDQLVHVEGSI